jgi:hypothetical protein
MGEGGRRSDMRHSADQCLNVEPTSLGLVGILALRRRPLHLAQLNRRRIRSKPAALDRCNPIGVTLTFQPRQNVFAAVSTLPRQGYIARFCVTLAANTWSAVLAELANRRGWVVGHLSRDALNRPQDNAGFFPNAMAAKIASKVTVTNYLFCVPGRAATQCAASENRPPPP